jgi:hypothetical protein
MAIGMTAALIGVGLAVAGAGAYMQHRATERMAREQKAASTRAENLRQQQNQLDAMRRRRQAYRESILARSQAMAAGTNMGSAGAGSSGVIAGAGNAVSTGAQNQQTLNSSQVIGAGMFDANRDYANATARGQIGQSWGSTLTSLGGMLIQNAGTFSRVGTYASQRPMNLLSFTG